jgi:ribosome-associated translation inhibitor RaiA
MSRSAFTDGSFRGDKAQRGRTPAEDTPVEVRSTTGVPISERLREHVKVRLGRQLGPFALRIERVSVRFEDLNGPRGGVDTVCRIKVVFSGLPSIVTQERAASAEEAFDFSANALQQAVRRKLEASKERRRER